MWEFFSKLPFHSLNIYLISNPSSWPGFKTILYNSEFLSTVMTNSEHFKPFHSYLILYTNNILVLNSVSLFGKARCPLSIIEFFPSTTRLIFSFLSICIRLITKIILRFFVCRCFLFVFSNCNKLILTWE